MVRLIFLNYKSLKSHLQLLEAHCKKIRLLKSISSSASLKASLEKKKYLALFSAPFFSGTLVFGGTLMGLECNFSLALALTVDLAKKPET